MSHMKWENIFILLIVIKILFQVKMHLIWFIIMCGAIETAVCP